MVAGALAGGSTAVQGITFADGTTWTRSHLAFLVQTGMSGFNTITGTAGGDSIVGTSDADMIDGKGAPSGSQDYEQGNGGGDAFIYNAGYGQLEVNANGGGDNVLKLGSGVTPSSVSVTDQYANIYLADGTAGDRIALDYELWGAGYGVDKVQFADGTVWTQAQLVFLASAGTSGSDIIAGTSGNDILDGRGGADTISGNGGYDTYLFRQGYGALTIDNSVAGGMQAQGEVDFGPGITGQNLWFSQVGSDLVASVLGSADTVDIKGWFGGNPSAQLAELKAFDGTKLDGKVGQLVSAMAAYQGANPGYSPATMAAMPNDPSLRSAIAAAWHG